MAKPLEEQITAVFAITSAYVAPATLGLEKVSATMLDCTAMWQISTRNSAIRFWDMMHRFY
jgi:hypothetical protein